MDLLRVLVLAAAVAAGYAGWRRYRYPGRWVHAFGREHAEARDDLAGARRHAAALERESRRERGAVRSELERERARHRDRVRSVERRMAGLRRPGRGDVVAVLGDVTVHEHAVLVGDQEIPLAGLKVRLDHAQHQHFLYLTRPGGRSALRRYARDEHAEEEVRRFAVRLEDAVADENAFRIRVAAELEQAREDLERARADTGAQDAARARVAEVEERQRRDTRPQQARRDLLAACDRWEELTGRRPRPPRGPRRP